MAEQVRWVVLALQVGQTLVARPEGLPDQVGALLILRAHLVDIEAPGEGQGEAGDARVGVGAPRGGQAESLCLVVEFPSLDAALGPDGAPGGVNPDAIHPAQVNHQAAVAHAVAPPQRLRVCQSV